MFRWFPSWRKTRSPKPTRQPKSNRSLRMPLRVEHLETRSLPTVSAIAPPAFVNAGTIATGGTPDSIAPLTLDNGSKILLVANFTQSSVSVLGDDGTGQFTALSTLTTGAGPNGFAVGDLGKGHQGFAIANYNSGTISVFLGDGLGHFSLTSTLTTGSSPANELALGDFNRDGRLDLAAANQNDGTVSVFLANGAGTFAPVSTYGAGPGSDAVVAGDFLGHGNLDLAVANFNSNTATLLTNDGRGHFQTAATLNVGANPFYIVAGDFNNDGAADLATANLSGSSVSVLHNLGDGNFSRQDVTVGGAPDALAVGDINGDGSLDLVASCYSGNGVTQLLNNGDATFQVSSFPANSGAGPNGIALADFNNDRSPDVAIANQDTTSASVFLNTSIVGVQGQALGNVILARFIDSTPQSADEYAAAIDWNDGSAVENGVIIDLGNGQYGVSSPGHTYSVAGVYHVQVTATVANENSIVITTDVHIRSSGSITGAVFNDRNGDGAQDSGETALGRWTVQLYDSTGHFVGSTRTADDGTFVFSGLAVGSYLVQEVLPTGWTHTAGPADTVSVSANGTTTLQLGAFQNLTLAGTAFSDLNGNGVQDAGEAGLAGWTIELFTSANGQLSSSPVESTTTDTFGSYRFSDLGPLATGVSYVLAEVLPDGWVQTSPSSELSGSIALPDGHRGYLLSATGGVSTVMSGGGDAVSGTGEVTLTALNNTDTIATISYDDGTGNARSVEAYVSQFAVHYTDNSGFSGSFNTFCIDLFHDVGLGQTTSVYADADLSSDFANAGRMAFLYQTYGTANLSSNPAQAAALQLALWDLSLNNHNPASFLQDADGSYSSGDANIFHVALANGGDAGAIASLVNAYLQESVGRTATTGWLDASASGSDLNRGQSLIFPSQSYDFGNVHLTFTNLQVSYGSGTTVTLSGTVVDPSPAGATVAFSGVVTGSVRADSNGYFTFTTQASGLGNVTLVATDAIGLSSAPATLALTVNSPQFGTLSVAYGSGTTVTITGTVSAAQAGGLTIVFGGKATGSVITNADGSFSFTAQASGLGDVTVNTADAWGQAAPQAQVTLAPTAPQITNFTATETTQGSWTFTGKVTGQNVQGMLINFGGLMTLQGKTALVLADGTFSLSLSLEEAGTATAQTIDPWGQPSNIASIFVDPTP